MGEYIMVSTNDRFKTVTENPNLEVIGEYEYYFFGKKRTTFSICKIKGAETRIVIQGVSEVFADNSIPIKVFPKFETIEEIEKEIYELDQDVDGKIVKIQ